MIEFNSYIRNPSAPRIFANDLGGVYRLDSGIVQVTFVQKFYDPNLNALEQCSLIWPEHNWHEYADKLRWVTEEIVRGTFRRDIPQCRAH